MKNFVSSLLVPPLLLKRYLDSTQEIAKLKKVDSSLRSENVKEARILINRMALLEKMPKDSICAEVGVASGDFSIQILDICKPRKIHLIDYWADNRSAHGIDPSSFAKRILSEKKSDWDIVNKKFQKEISERVVELHRGFSWDMLAKFDDHYFDFVYIDAAHDYDSVVKDLKVAAQKIKLGGILAGHDYVRWGRFGYKCGVVEAVNEFCIKNEYEILYITAETKTNASFAIRKIAAA